MESNPALGTPAGSARRPLAITAHRPLTRFEEDGSKAVRAAVAGRFDSHGGTGEIEIMESNVHYYLSFRKESVLACPAATLYDWHMQEGAFEVLTLAWAGVRIASRPAWLAEGSEVVLQMRMGLFPIRWVARHSGFVSGRQFVDEQVVGPFRHWHHKHEFRPLTEDSCLMVDFIRYSIWGGALCNRIAEPFLRKRLQKMFDYRHDQLRKCFGGATNKAPLAAPSTESIMA